MKASAPLAKQLTRTPMVGDDGALYYLVELSRIDAESSDEPDTKFYRLADGSVVDPLGPGEFLVRSTRVRLRPRVLEQSN